MQLTDLSLHILCCIVQATERIMGTVDLQNMLTLINLSDREKENVLDSLIDLEDSFRSVLTLIQRRKRVKLSVCTFHSKTLGPLANLSRSLATPKAAQPKMQYRSMKWTPVSST